MQKKWRRYFLKTKEAKNFINKAREKLKTDLQVFENISNIEIIESESCNIILMNGKPVFFKIGDNIFPTLIAKEILALMPKVVVDMGAISHICSGADVMAPGIVGIEGEFRKGDLVYVADERHCKPIAVGEAVSDLEEIKRVKRGVAVKNYHYVGDKMWNLLKEIEEKSRK